MPLTFSLDPFQQLNAACVTAFGSAVPVVFFSQFYSGSPPNPGVVINAIPKDPSMLDQYPIGSTSTLPSVIHLFVNFYSVSPVPANGDTFSVNGSNYVMFDIGSDVSGGTFLKLRRQ